MSLLLKSSRIGSPTMIDVTDFYEQQVARDKRLADRAITAADNFSLYLKTWIQEEIIALVPMIDERIKVEKNPLRKAEQEQALRMLDELDRFEINLVADLFNSMIDELRQEVYDDGLDAHQYAQDALSSLERLVRRLLRMRREVSIWLNEAEPAKGESDVEEGS